MDGITKIEEYFIPESENEIGFVNIQLRINKKCDRKSVINLLMKSIHKGTDLIEGAQVQELYFHGRDIMKKVEDLKEKMKKDLIETINCFKF